MSPVSLATSPMRKLAGAGCVAALRVIIRRPSAMPTRTTSAAVDRAPDGLGFGRAASSVRLDVDVAAASHPRGCGRQQTAHDGEVEGGVQPGPEGSADEAGEELAAGEGVLLGDRQRVQLVGADEVLYRVIAQEGREQRGDCG